MKESAIYKVSSLIIGKTYWLRILLLCSCAVVREYLSPLEGVTRSETMSFVCSFMLKIYVLA